MTNTLISKGDIGEHTVTEPFFPGKVQKMQALNQFLFLNIGSYRSVLQRTRQLLIILYLKEKHPTKVTHMRSSERAVALEGGGERETTVYGCFFDSCLCNK